MAPPVRAADEKILTYNDVVLRRSDLDILNGHHFINDRLIEFFFAHLSSSTSTSTVLLVPPSISFFLANCPDPATLLSLASDLRLPDRNIIIFTVNDNGDVNLAEGGSHWSLLVFDRRADEFVHLDSNGGMNRHAAKKLYKAVRGLAGCGRGKLVEMPVPQQGNWYDCGLHVMSAARGICRWHEGDPGEGRWLPAVREEVGKVPQMRGELLRLITEMMKQQRSDQDQYKTG